MPKTARDIAVSALVQWEREHTYSNIMLDNLLKEAKLSAADTAFTTRLVYGVIERLLTVDWMLQKNSRQPLKKCHPTVRAILRVGAYQLMFMEKIPPSAAVNEAVGQVKRMKQPYAVGFVNGVLRAVADKSHSLLLSLNHDIKGQSVRHSVPIDLLNAWKQAYGLQTSLALAAAANEVPPAVIRVNTLKTSVEAFKALLCERHISYEAVEGLAAALVIHDAAMLRANVDDTLWYAQDAASQWACEALDAQPAEHIADVCAAPGGKSLTTAMRIHDDGKLLSCDIYEEKTKTLQKRASYYGVHSLTAVCRDASLACPAAWQGRFDRVICDVPCSGFGVIRRRPEIRYKPLSDFDELPELQYRILCQAAAMVKTGGVLQYSTCTLRPQENEQVAERFLREHPDFAPRELPTPLLFDKAGLVPSYHITLMPHIHQTDGFFIASFRKEGTA